MIGFTGFERGGGPSRVVFDPKDEKAFPDEMSISPDRTPGWTDDLANLTFGIRKVRKKPADDKAAGAARGAGAAPDAEKADDAPADEKPDLVLWHHKDPRLQSQQQVEEERDKRFSYLCLYPRGRQDVRAPRRRRRDGRDAADGRVVGRRRRRRRLRVRRVAPKAASSATCTRST